jgi:pimeloyl-ACP methyl ester carboxylesterase
MSADWCISQLQLPAPVAGDGRVLLIMLPGAGIAAEEFVARGLVAALHAQELPVDVVVVQPDLALYLEDGVVGVLHRAVVEPAWARGYRRIWLLGISLGGMGALLYTSAHPDAVEGLVLLAPFLGTRGTMAELAKAGGLDSWSAACSAATAPELRLLTWLRNHLACKAARPALYLGYGLHDRFASEQHLLARQLPPMRVAALPGGHDWPTWTALWQALLAKSPFSASDGGGGRCAGANIVAGRG